jgi:hypothetical protein
MLADQKPDAGERRLGQARERLDFGKVLRPVPHFIGDDMARHDTNALWDANNSRAHTG